MRIPSATYRLQFTSDFGFAQAAAVVDYLHELGISDIYASPIFQARPGSQHGYDVVDPNQLNPELGTVEEFETLITSARRLGIGWVQDIVPNHMAYDSGNKLLMDVLENGPSSPYSDFFDIQWDHPYESMKGKILAPFLGRFYGECLEDGEIVLRYDASGFRVVYYGLTLPVNIEAYSEVLTENFPALRRRIGADHLDYIKLLGVLYTLKNIAPGQESAERTDQIIFVKRILWELYSGNEAIRRHLDDNLARFNGVKGKPESFNQLDRLLSQQWYRLSFWKVAAEELDYRRFFNINELISLRMEEERVYRHTHKLILQLAQEGKFTGLRIDHVDGLYDPLGYLTRLRGDLPDTYLTVEKILAFDEELPEDWPVQGSTGYEFLNYLNGIFCASGQSRTFSQIYTRFAGLDTSAAALMVEKKRLIIGKYMAGDIEGLAFLLRSVSSHDRHSADVTLYGLKRALVEVLAFFPVYRSYVRPGHCSAEDRRWLSAAVGSAKAANAGLLLELNFIERFLLLDFGEHLSEEEKGRWIHFVMRFQQLTGPLMAKGFEDTTLYVYDRLLSLNDVGGDPDRFGVTVDEFHDFNLRRSRWPHAMNATATHDTKRGEDARARISALSEVPREWEQQLKSWGRINRAKKSKSRGREVPDRNDEYFLYQTLLGAYPAGAGHDADFVERLKAYLIKAVREAKVHTEWLKPDEGYEKGFVDFVEAILLTGEGNDFLSEFQTFAKDIAHCGMFISLAQTLLKIATPGIPDIYQGTEFWDLSFVDPDNRRPVDFAERRRLLNDFKNAEARDLTGLLADLLAHWQDGRIKLYLTHKLLVFRRAHPELFAEGGYIPLHGTGEMSERVCAFARRHKGNWVVVIAPRLIGAPVFHGGVPLAEFWAAGALALPAEAPERWRDLISGEQIETGPENLLPLAKVFRYFPISLLVHEERAGARAAAEESIHATSNQSIA
jgi:(1->4)-alpha-D-glucan 1-alpha-D-glucosylmutase